MQTTTQTIDVIIFFLLIYNFLKFFSWQSFVRNKRLFTLGIIRGKFKDNWTIQYILLHWIVASMSGYLVHNRFKYWYDPPNSEDNRMMLSVPSEYFCFHHLHLLFFPNRQFQIKQLRSQIGDSSSFEFFLKILFWCL